MKEIKEYDWWEVTKRYKKDPATIQYTYKNGGVVRARSDDRTPWETRVCGNAKNAFGIGIGIINCQRGENEEPNYYGA